MAGKKHLLLTLLTVISFVLSACTPKPTFELYEGNPLRIAMIGDLPKVKEEQVSFTEISFDGVNFIIPIPSVSRVSNK